MALKGKIKIKLPTGWAAQRTTERMTKGCHACGVPPGAVRMVHSVESYPYPTQQTYCIGCAYGVIKDNLKEQMRLADEALAVLQGLTS